MTKALIRKYLNGECSKEEEKVAIKLLNEANGAELLDEIADEFWSEDQPEYEQINSQRLYDRVLNNIQLSRIKKWSVLKYAASLAILLTVSFLIYQYSFSKQDIVATETIETVTRMTQKGQKSTVILSDGSKVILNSLSKISYPKYFTDSSRLIHLEGEAFFEVSKDPKRPFTVTANKVETTALGTSFNINSRSSIQKVLLATGKVLVSAKNSEQHILTPGEGVEVNAENGDSKKFQFDQEKALGWKDGIIYFEDSSVDEIISVLELWYDVKIEIEKPIKNKSYTGRFDNESLRNVLESISFALDFDFIMNGKNVKIINP
ncbi:MAG: DUF4974 domain-containing protein [Fulvivirga sp.]